MKKIIRFTPFLILFLIPVLFQQHTKQVQYKQSVVTQNLKENKQNEVPDQVAGVLSFTGNLLEIPFVQGEDNAYYLSHDMDGNWFYQGTPFLDYRDTLFQPSFMIYGHHVFDDETAAFSPLMKLEQQDIYQQNHRFTITTKTETKTYEITHVFRSSTRKQFNPREQHQENFDQWIQYPNTHNAIIPINTLNAQDHIVILQTCARYHNPEKLFIIAKEVE